MALQLLACAPLAASAAEEMPVFEPRADGIGHRYLGGWEYFVGGGLAVFDCDGDHLPELYAAGGSAPATLLRNRTERPGGRLSYVAETPDALALTGVTGAYPLDIDSDGHLDLVVLRVGPNAVMKGQGACHYTPWPLVGKDDGDAWTTAFSAIWEAGRALPTLAFGNYVDRADPEGPFGTCDVNLLYRPGPGGYGPPTVLEPGFCALSMLFSDWGRRGRADLRISNDRHYYLRGGQEQMWAMEAVPRLYAEAEGWRSYQLWGMGIASRDLTGDGLPEVYLSSMGDQRLQSLAPDATGPDFRDASYERGTSAHRPYTGGDGRPSTGWHVAFGDVTNDGLDDIFVAKGNVEQMPGLAMADPNNLLIQAPDGSFAEAGDRAGIATLARSRGAALADLNRDGRLDLAVVNRRAPLEIYQNVTADPGHWLAIALEQPAPNVRAVGAWIEIDAGGRRISREVTIGGGHAGGAALPEHFGLGPAATVRLRVIWPGGETSNWRTVAADQSVTVRRGEGSAVAVSGF